MSYQNYNALTLSVTDRIATVTLNRPEKLNAVDERMHEELARVFVDLNNDPDCDVVVIMGAGRAFSSGGISAGCSS
jgi:enoyl-CoA hydratase